MLAHQSPNNLKTRLDAGLFSITAEIEPPKGSNPQHAYEQATALKPYINAVNITDAPMANLRMSSIALAHLLQTNCEVETIFHFTCRDRNVIALQADLLGAAGLGANNVLMLTGDPPSRGDHPEAQGVFEVDVVELISMARNLNQGKSLGKDLEDKTNFTVVAAANPTAKDLVVEKSKIYAKLEAGTNLFQTQPVFSVEDVERFQDSFDNDLPAPFLYGILPLRSAKMARNMAKWCNVPDSLVDNLEADGKQAGINHAKTLIQDLKDLGVAGVHLYPLGHTEDVPEIIDSLSDESAVIQDTGMTSKFSHLNSTNLNSVSNIYEQMFAPQ